MHNRTALALSIALFAAAAIFTHAGPLDPPAGPVSPTYKTLSEVEPRIAISAANTPGDANSLYKITQPGSYYLTGNITGVATKAGIEIAASGVTIDLMGFALTGIPGTLDGITVEGANLSRITILNGSISGWGGSGINFFDGGVSGSLIHDVLAGGNTGVGIRVGVTTIINRCTASGNTGPGFAANNGCTVTECTATANSVGFELGAAGVASGCTAFNNNGVGIHVQSTFNITGCTARANGADGIVVQFGNTLVEGNVSANNGAFSANGAGIRVSGSDCRLEANQCLICRIGIAVSGAGNIIIRNTCSGSGNDWDIAANNVFGPIIDRRAPASAAVLGFSAASTLGSTDPNANFSF